MHPTRATPVLKFLQSLGRVMCGVMPLPDALSKEMRLYIILVLAAVALVAVLILKRGSIVGMTRSGRREHELYRNLLRKSFGDKAQVERLIEGERRRKPNASRAVWMKDAIDRWERHNR
jgi:hypothetical protein